MACGWLWNRQRFERAPAWRLGSDQDHFATGESSVRPCGCMRSDSGSRSWNRSNNGPNFIYRRRDRCRRFYVWHQCRHASSRAELRRAALLRQLATAFAGVIAWQPRSSGAAYNRRRRSYQTCTRAGTSSDSAIPTPSQIANASRKARSRGKTQESTAALHCWYSIASRICCDQS